MKKTTESFKKELIRINPNVEIRGEYINTHAPILTVCKKCNYEWSPSPHTLLQGIGCPACSGRVPIIGVNDFETVHPELMLDWDYNENELCGIIPGQLTQRSGKKVNWKCHVCGNKWIATPDKRVSGSACPACAKRKQLDSRINTLIRKNGSLADNHDLMLDWCKSENEKNGLFAQRLTTKSNYEADWRCHVCGYNWKAIISNRTAGAGCPVCANKVVVTGKNDIATTNPELLLDWDYSENSGKDIFPTSVSYGSAIEVSWKCHFCGYKWKSVIYSRSNGTGCPACAKRWQSSLPEQALYFYLSKIFGDAVNRYKTDWLGLSELDIYIPSLSLGIEYDGQAWHQNIQNDISKYQLCKEHGIVLLRIREPKCPVLSEKYWTYVRKSKSISSIPEMIKGVFKELSDRLGIVIDLEVPFEKDKPEILSLSGYHPLKENISAYEFVIRQWDYEKNAGLKPEYFTKGSNTSIIWKCDKCGQNWSALISDRFAGKGCPYCAGKRVLKGMNDFATKHPDMLSEWDYEKNKNVSPTNITEAYSKNVGWKCKKCGFHWMARVSNRVYENSGCPACYERRRSKKVAQYNREEMLLQTFNTAKAAAIFINGNMRCIQQVCQGRRKSYKGYLWRYID